MPDRAGGAHAPRRIAVRAPVRTAPIQVARQVRILLRPSLGFIDDVHRRKIPFSAPSVYCFLAITIGYAAFSLDIGYSLLDIGYSIRRQGDRLSSHQVTQARDPPGEYESKVGVCH